MSKWRCADGCVMEISEMDDEHLNNCIDMIKRGYAENGAKVGPRTKAMLPQLLEEHKKRYGTVPFTPPRGHLSTEQGTAHRGFPTQDVLVSSARTLESGADEEANQQAPLRSHDGETEDCP